MGADEVTGGFNTVNISGWIWGTDITLDNNLDLVSWWGQVDLFTYSYAWAGDPKSIDDDLYSAIGENDIRKDQFIDAYGDGVLYPIGKFYAPAQTIGGQRSVETDYVYMRIAEMYLLNAEAAAKTGDEATALASLKALLDKRMDDTSYLNTLSGNELLDEIYLQTRIELWGEGKSYLAMKRNKATITRGPNHLSYAGESFSYDDDRLTLEIPQVEIQNNPNIN
ncbi:RagB/SusD family nutrient uptake outer membrane protein [Galbibacter sp. BG1]|uniref:RagB/SusD family nutrient uptake outer membrane protein n=1 Tax=Galbibacter sp. BG1 TaxID=1170699 RepID=UPI0021047B3E|nr:RagB/SusD family nutrient uptake outer membrane protein [Galbibacter sp. BG1]